MSDGDDPGPLKDRIGAEDLSFDTVEYGEAIGGVLDEISERDRMVLHLRFVEDMTQSEIADRVGGHLLHEAGCDDLRQPDRCERVTVGRRLGNDAERDCAAAAGPVLD